jgi:hypothetical protein
MRRVGALTILAVPVAVAACGASSTASTRPAAPRPVAAAPLSAASCPRVARAELVAVARRIYVQAVSGRNETAAVARLRASTALGRAVAAHRPRAVRAALAPLLQHRITRIVVSAGGRTLARIGTVAAYAPVHGVISLNGRAVGGYVLSVGDARGFTALTDGLTGASVRFTRHPGPSTVSFPAVTFPAGRTAVALTIARHPPIACGHTAVDTRLNAIGYVARNLMNAEQRGPTAQQALRHAASNAAFRRAIAAGDPAAVRAAIIGFFRDSRFHIVRVRAWRGARLITDVGGPYVLSPASSSIRGPSGSVVGHFMLSVQDDTGFIKLMHRFTGADVVLHAAAGPVPGGNLFPGPPFAAGVRGVRWRGRSYRDLGLRGSAFPSGALRISLLTPAAG